MRPWRPGALLGLAAFLAACSAGQPGHAGLPSPEPALSAAPAGVALHHAAVPPPAARGARAAHPAQLRKEALVVRARPSRLQAAAAVAGVPIRTVPATSTVPAIPTVPAIISASALPNIVREGDTVTWDVRTTRDVVAVEAHVRLASFSLQRDRPGHFEMVFRVPAGVPPVFHGTYAVELTARAADGASATRTLEVRFE